MEASERVEERAEECEDGAREVSAGAAFDELGLSDTLVEAVRRAGYERPTEIQRQAIPPALEGTDILGTAHTGTGKTAAFALPMIQKLADGRQHDRPRGLIITPTRELAQQVAAAVTRYGSTSSIETVLIHGGTPLGPEIRELRFGCDVLVATPGRLLDHLKRGNVDLSQLEVFVLDEADRMLDMGFIDDVKEIAAATPSSRQTFLFSATMPNGVLYLAHELMRDPVRVQVGFEAAAEGIREVIHPVDWSSKQKLLLHLIEEEMTDGQVLVFVRMRVTASYLCEFLQSHGVSVDALHGGRDQKDRTKSLQRFREGGVRVLVATNVAARGLDILGIRHVVNFDVPEDPRDYVHRVGRTARGDDTGDAITLMSPNDWLDVKEIEKLTECRIERRVVPGFEPDVQAPTSHLVDETQEPARERSRLTRGIRRR